MKQLLFLFAIVFVAFSIPTFTGGFDAKAQIVRTVKPVTAKDSVVNTDTVIINVNPESNHVSGIHVVGSRASGTVAGKIVLQASNDNVNWKGVDSVTLTNVPYVFVSFATPNRLPYARYRCQYISSGTNKVTGIRGQLVTRQR